MSNNKVCLSLENVGKVNIFYSNLLHNTVVGLLSTNHYFNMGRAAS